MYRSPPSTWRVKSPALRGDGHLSLPLPHHYAMQLIVRADDGTCLVFHRSTARTPHEFHVTPACARLSSRAFLLLPLFRCYSLYLYAPGKGQPCVVFSHTRQAIVDKVQDRISPHATILMPVLFEKLGDNKTVVRQVCIGTLFCVGARF